MSIAHNNRKQLEALGDYVTRAKINWFAVFPKKLEKFAHIASSQSRESNLVVYRRHLGDERDHHAIPMSVASELFTLENLAHSEVNGISRWNVTLVDHILKVTHSEKTIDVREYFRAPLAIEVMPLETNHKSELAVRAIDIEPPSRVQSVTYRILRDTVTTRQLKIDHGYQCQICGTCINLPDGSKYAEVHHIRPLGRPHCGPDTRENMIVLCPNHHAMCDYRGVKLDQKMIRKIDGHSIGIAFIHYHNALMTKQSKS
jgi:hypothetical protein